jgi:hypothetical protein
MLMLAAYVDESGHSKDPKCRFVGLAGFVATAAQWDVFQLQWKGALDEFNDGEEFHAKEFYRRSSQSKYTNWSQEKKDGFIARLTGSLEAAQAKAVGCIVSLDHYEQLKESERRATVDPYYMAFQEVTKGLALSGSPIMNDDLKVDPVSMVYAYQKEYGATDAGRAMQLWNIIKSHPDKFIWAEWMGTYASAFPREMLPLQAADLFAYELTREFEEWAKPSPKTMRKALKSIIRSQKGNLLIKLYDRSAMLDMLWNSGAFSDATTADSPIVLEAYTTMKVVRDTLLFRANE